MQLPDRPPTRDRLEPGAAGGTYTAANIVIVCDPCNTDRGTWTLPAFHAALAAEGDPRAEHVAAFLAALMS